MRFFIPAIGVLAGLGSCRVVPRQQCNAKAIVAHYMIGGINDDHVLKDIQDAKSLGLDAFAMNFDQFAYWSNTTVERLFKHADAENFKLFFSFDHAKSPGLPSPPKKYASFLKTYMARPSYFRLNNKPLVTTFGGESIPDGDWSDLKKDAGPMNLVLGSYTSSPTSFFSGRNSVDGVFNWNSWPDSGTKRKDDVSCTADKAFQTAANGKIFMMGISPGVFKHLDQGQNWYRRGERNLELRLGQALEVQPDIIQLQTWNDAGEGHYMGNIWPESMTTSPNIQALTNSYDHKGYWQILKAFSNAWHTCQKTTSNMVPTNGKSVQGTFWHHTLTINANCGSDPLAKSPDVLNVAEDAVSGILLVAKGKAGLVGVVNVGTKQLGITGPLKEGFNSFKFTGLTPGKVQLEVWDGSTLVAGGYAPLEVQSSGPLCNYNFQVVGV